MTRSTKLDIETFLNQEDIEGLLGLGAPRDEYSNEARSIAGALHSAREGDLSEDSVVSIMVAVWTGSFGPFSDHEIHQRLPGLRRVAQRILAA
jgi:hypothetical protein